MSSVYSLPIVSFFATAALTWLVRRFALSRGIIDQPNSRSSHTVPTPRGGGLAIVIATSLSVSALWWWQVVDSGLALAFLGGGAPIAWIGFMDDHGSVSVSLRFAVHIGVALLAMYLLGGLPPLQFGHAVVDLGITGHVLGTVAIVWVLNLFNFMDGIDGIAASEAVFVTGAGAALAIVGGLSAVVPACALVVCGASMGFLVWNWPPAKIFMGDVGSGYLGYVIALLAIAAARESPVAVFVWLILGGLFFIDATVTLLRRLLRHERIYEAHRSHVYQVLSRRWGSHRRVTLLVWIVNCVWLFPIAWLCVMYPMMSNWLVLVALGPPLAFSVVTRTDKAA